MTIIFWVLFWFHFPLLLFWALFGLALGGLGTLLKSQTLEVYGRRLAISADQMGNGFAGGFPDETLSARVGRAIISGRPKMIARVLAKFINGIFFWESNHVVDAIENYQDFDKYFEPWPWTEYTQQELAEKRKKI